MTCCAPARSRVRRGGRAGIVDGFRKRAISIFLAAEAFSASTFHVTSHFATARAGKKLNDCKAASTSQLTK